MIARKHLHATTGALFAASLALTACQSGDPHSDDLFSGIHGIVSGDYQKRVDEQNQGLLKTQYDLGQQRRANDALAGIARRKAITVKQLQGQVTAMESQTKALRARMRELEATRADAEGRLPAARERLAKLEGDLDILRKRAADTDTLTKDLTDEQAQLEAEIGRLKDALEKIESH